MFGNDWDKVLHNEIQKPYFKNLQVALGREYKEQIVYPPQEFLFSAFKETSYQETRVVILGQDPYHGPGQAHGLSFSVMPGVRIPPSLRNIYTELKDDLGVSIPNHGSLLHWAQEGVLLLNAVLTVRQGQPNSHKSLGWETFTDAVMEKLNERNIPMVFMLWGSHAQKKGSFLTKNRHHIIQSTHPSPLSAYRGFLGSRPFSETNQYLESQGLKGIDWAIEST
ncbi:uracil-DNA glycosylase [Paenibacillus wynnii]|uniref:Uracil-DNA glycosylase n=1 Tax=Paenibacillus wynnii TaxID=268407 RepID=A0A098M7N4_9BACL|nr:uracil-DNA glycosylase [Paenibacillus wynnii]KGE18043.1 uracil-DNA glycosylase [Paenibacillus wynnii]